MCLSLNRVTQFLNIKYFFFLLWREGIEDKFERQCVLLFCYNERENGNWCLNLDNRSFDKKKYDLFNEVFFNACDFERKGDIRYRVNGNLNIMIIFVF